MYKFLFVEGNDEKAFFSKLFNHLNIPCDIETRHDNKTNIYDVKGVDNFPIKDSVPKKILMNFFDEEADLTVAFICDADCKIDEKDKLVARIKYMYDAMKVAFEKNQADFTDDKWNELKNQIKNDNELIFEINHYAFDTLKIKLGIYLIVEDLEDYILQNHLSLTQKDCIDSFFNCNQIQESSSKQKMMCYLATLDKKPKYSINTAMSDKDGKLKISFDDSIFNPLKSFLTIMFA